PITVPIEDVLDLHTFLPKEIPSLLNEYLSACRQAEIYSVRIIHGKGKGQLKNRVQGLLKKHPMVASFSDAPSRAGGWGATIVELRRAIDFASPEWARLLDEGSKAMNMPLNHSQIDQFAIHARELVAWNRSVNLTAIIDPVEVAVKHFLDTLPVSPMLPQGSSVLDIGSGGGFPGIPLKVMRPDLHIMLIDGTRKKVSFQKHIISTLALEDIQARHVRAEDLESELQPESRRYDIIVSKAVSKLDVFLDLAIPLLRRPGTVIAMKGKSVEVELEAVRSRVKADGLSLVTKKYRLPYLDIERSLIVLSDTPDLLA
ncbi:MAG: 16S rRNA (guanine(527)-N(7))-methyltransferase RsmG, partial [Deltaproteobacteria bacterium]|nr:16S rRNA (guanine(527)-N(7))-methyltransferase RsmG [Deltaproteobacteria bacterium]